MAVSSAPNSVEIKRVGKFGIVGIANTLLDFGIMNALTKFAHFGLIQANIISTTCAMVFSFYANKKVVFKQEGGSVARQGVLFLAVTAFGLYVVQTTVIYVLVHLWPVALDLAVKIIRHLGIHLFSDGFYINNGAKAVATLASMTWNYIMYKKVVFK